jgi:hypothetical protein
MINVATVSQESVRRVRSTAKNVVEAYRVLAHKGVAIERQAMSIGIGVVGARFATIDPVLGSLHRVNQQATEFAGAVVDGVAEQANAVVDGVADVAAHIVVNNLGAMNGRVGTALEKVAMPVAMPVRYIAMRAEDASERMLNLVKPAKRRVAATTKRAKRVVRKARARRAA